MRCSKQTIIWTTCALLVLAACWAIREVPVISNAVAQAGAPERPRTMKKGELYTELSRSRIEAILDEPIPEVNIFQVPLRQVLVELKTLTGLDIYFDAEELGDVIDPDVPVDVQVAEKSMTFETLIQDLILGPLDLVFLIRDNHLVIMSYNKSLTQYEVVVYDCRDILETMPADESPADVGGSGYGTAANDAAGGPGGVAGAGSGMPGFSGRKTREQRLIEVIQLTIRNEDSPWEYSSGKDGDIGTIAAINGLLVIRQTQAVHAQVERLLELLRTALQERERSPAAKHESPAPQ